MCSKATAIVKDQQFEAISLRRHQQLLFGDVSDDDAIPVGFSRTLAQFGLTLVDKTLMNSYCKRAVFSWQKAAPPWSWSWFFLPTVAKRSLKRVVRLLQCSLSYKTKRLEAAGVM